MRVSATTIEQFRLVCQTDWAHEADLIAQIKKETKPTWQMAMGTAWHETLRRPKQRDGGGYESGEYWFADKAVHAGQKLVGLGEWEIKHVVEIGPVQLVCKADLIRGYEITDIKTTCGTPDLCHYEPSLQWRLYLLAFEACRFRYLIFQFKEPDESGFAELKSSLSCTFWAYPAMAQECAEWIGKFTEWAKSKKLEPWLVEKPLDRTEGT